MNVSATEFKSNIGKYLTLVEAEDIYITKHGKNVARLTSAKPDKIEIAKSLFGIIPSNSLSLEQAREERRSRYEVAD